MIKKKNLIFIGAPGSGKGTISGKLLEQETLIHISTGDILRSEIKRGTELGKQAAEIMKQGGLVSDDIVVGMVRDRLSQDDCQQNGFVLDGFPRTQSQAQMLDKVLADLSMSYDAVVYFDVNEATLLQRLTSRLTCKACGAVFNKITMAPKKAGICDQCNGELIQRADDSLETAKNRLSVFCSQTQPVIDFYLAAGKTVTLKDLNIDQAMALLKKALY